MRRATKPANHSHKQQPIAAEPSKAAHRRLLPACPIGFRRRPPKSLLQLSPNVKSFAQLSAAALEEERSYLPTTFAAAVCENRRWTSCWCSAHPRQPSLNTPRNARCWSALRGWGRCALSPRAAI